MRSKECVAMILAGGQGSRLGILTSTLAKPAIFFGGKYRLIDFSLSNCRNSGIDTVGILTQYQPLELHTYIGVGSAWDLDRNTGGVFILSPFVQANGGEWYKGTANAIHQNTGFIDQYQPQYLLVLSGDHVYKMDYSLMLEYHKENQADATIAVVEVPWNEAGRFGIMNVTPEGKIIEFEEKPKQPKNNLASMGIYVFSWEALKEYLAQDDQEASSAHDFGKNVIPAMLKDGRKMMAYSFKGYWRDVGTVESLWEANMDLLSDNNEMDLCDDNWKIFSASPSLPPHLVTSYGKVSGSVIDSGCLVYGEVKNSVLFSEIEISKGAVIKDSVIMPKAKIGGGTCIEKAIVGPGAVIGENCRIGCDSGENDRENITVIGEQVTVSAGTVVRNGTVVDLRS